MRLVTVHWLVLDRVALASILELERFAMSSYLDEMAECAKEARSGIPPGKFRVLLVDRWDGTGGEVGIADTLEAATAWAKRLHNPANMQTAYVYNDSGECVFSA